MVLHLVMVGVTVASLVVAIVAVRQLRVVSDGETARIAAELAALTEETARNVDSQLADTHRLVNSRLDEALERIELLEHRLGLEPGEDPGVRTGTDNPT
jgi:hypothetical protein